MNKKQNKKVNQTANKYLQNLSKIHQLTLDKIDEALPKNGIKKVKFRAKIKEVLKRTSKKGREFYLVGFKDNTGMLDILYISDNEQLLEKIKQGYNNQTFIDVEIFLENYSDGALSIRIKNISKIDKKILNQT